MIFKKRIDKVSSFLMNVAAHIECGLEPSIAYNERLHGAYWFANKMFSVYDKRNRETIDDLKWRIVMLEEKLKDGEPIIGTGVNGGKRIYVTEDKVFTER